MACQPSSSSSSSSTTSSFRTTQSPPRLPHQKRASWVVTMHASVTCDDVCDHVVVVVTDVVVVHQVPLPA